MRAIVLFSGGLDSLLTTRVLQKQGIEVIGLNIATPFHDHSESVRKEADVLEIELIVHHTDNKYIELIAHPRFGYGKSANPCIDCRIEMCRVAGKYMEQYNAGFVATGEIVGQRPNNQMQHQLNLIQQESGLEGYLVRPLSAKIMNPTQPELKGWIDRKKLYSYTGRGRGRAIALAHRLGIKKIPPMSTGCFLCEKSYAPKVFDLFKHEPQPTNWDADVLNAGRQLRISPQIKIVLGRNENHCKRLEELFVRSDARPAILLIPESFQGPTALLIGHEIQEYIELAGTLIFRYTNPNKYDPATATIRICHNSNPNSNNPIVIPVTKNKEVQDFSIR
ncbi:MAG: hypothetical protein LBP87_07050 [Planctomycetaceae bacterium]|jgi:hypothetical protein|nr:hypothetical protein [Planctomycetaceae bacterium]